MKIAIPLEDEHVGEHFGHSPTFALYEVDEERRTADRRTVLPAPPHEPGVLPRWLRARGADVIIAGSMGRRAQEGFARHGIAVILGIAGQPADDAVAAYLDGTLKGGTNACDH